MSEKKRANISRAHANGAFHKIVADAIFAILGLGLKNRPGGTVLPVDVGVIMDIIWAYVSTTSYLKQALTLEPLHALGIHRGKTLRDLDIGSQLTSVIKTDALARAMTRHYADGSQRVTIGAISNAFFGATTTVEHDRKSALTAAKMVSVVCRATNANGLMELLRGLVMDWGSVGVALAYVFLRITINHVATDFLSNGHYTKPVRERPRKRQSAGGDTKSGGSKRTRTGPQISHMNRCNNKTVLFSFSVGIGPSKILVFHVHRSTLLSDVATVLHTLQAQGAPLLCVRGVLTRREGKRVRLGLEVLLSLLQGSINASSEEKTPAFIGEIMRYLFETQRVPNPNRANKGESLEALTVLLPSSSERDHKPIDARCLEALGEWKRVAYTPILVKPTEGAEGKDEPEHAVIDEVNGEEETLGVRDKGEAITRRVARWERRDPLLRLLHSFGWVGFSLSPRRSIARCSFKELFHGNALLSLLYRIQPLRRVLKKLGSKLVHRMHCDEKLRKWAPGEDPPHQIKVCSLGLQSPDLRASPAFGRMLEALRCKLQAVYNLQVSQRRQVLDYWERFFLPEFLSDHACWVPRICEYVGKIRGMPRHIPSLIGKPECRVALSWPSGNLANELLALLSLVKHRKASFTQYYDTIDAQLQKAIGFLNRVDEEQVDRRPLMEQDDLIHAMSIAFSTAVWHTEQNVGQNFWRDAFLKTRHAHSNAMRCGPVSAIDFDKGCCEGVETEAKRVAFDEMAQAIVTLIIQRRGASSSSTPEAKCPSLKLILEQICTIRVDVHKLARGALFGAEADGYAESCAQLLFSIAVRNDEHPLFGWVEDAMGLVALRVFVEPNMQVLYEREGRVVRDSCRRLFQPREEKQEDGKGGKKEAMFIDLT